MRVTFSICMAAVMFLALPVYAQKAGQSTMQSIGLVEKATPVELKDNKTGKGAAVGTAIGATRSSNNRTRSVLSGAALGSAAGAVASKKHQGMTYDVRTGPSSVITVTSNQTEIRVGDCVSVQQSGNTTTVSRVEQDQCKALEN